MVPTMSDGSFPEAHLSVQNLAARRGGRLVFHRLSFTASAGDAVTVVGPNGSGKSTLLRVLAGLMHPDSGSLVRTPDENEDLRFAGHREGLKSGLTVVENLTFWCRIYGAPPEHVDAALDRFNLISVADMPVDVLSAGWRRRAGLARLALGEAPLWILDEPYTALDAANVRRMDGLLEDHLSNGGIVVLATHQAPGFTAPHVIEMADYEAPLEEVPW